LLTARAKKHEVQTHVQCDVCKLILKAENTHTQKKRKTL